MENIFSRYEKSETLKNQDINLLNYLYCRIISLTDKELDFLNDSYGEDYFFNKTVFKSIFEFEQSMISLKKFLIRYSVIDNVKKFGIYELLFACLNFQNKEAQESDPVTIEKIKNVNDKLKVYFNSNEFKNTQSTQIKSK